MASKEIKQVIVMRKDLNMRKGKMVAQGSHASLSFLTRGIKNVKGSLVNKSIYNVDEAMQWFEEGFTKICVSVDSEAELMDIYERAMVCDLNVHLITDAGHTEFNGVPTKTCLAIGPNKASEINKITSHLKLL
jgi:PTH2 family peptidyl-tRNA hydrolase